MCSTTSKNSSRLHPSWRSNACTTRKDPEPEWLAKDNPETNPISVKPETLSHKTEQFSWVPLPSCSPLGGPLPNSLLLCQLCVSSDNSFPSVRQELPFGPWKVSSFCNTLRENQSSYLNNFKGITLVNIQGGAQPYLLLCCKILLGSPSSFISLGSQWRWNAIWITGQHCSWGKRCFLIVGRPGNQPFASLEEGHPPTALLPNTFLSQFPWSSAFTGGRRRWPSSESFTRSEVSTFLCSAQSPLRVLGSGGSQGPQEAKTESWLPPNLVSSANLCQFTPSVSPFLSCPLCLHTSCSSSGPDGWLRWNSFLLSVMPCSQAHTYLVQLPHCCSVIFLKFLTCLKTLGRKPLNLPSLVLPCLLQWFSISCLTQHYWGTDLDYCDTEWLACSLSLKSVLEGGAGTFLEALAPPWPGRFCPPSPHSPSGWHPTTDKFLSHPFLL